MWVDYSRSKLYTMQARREPQRGPGNHYHNLIPYAPRSRRPRHRERREGGNVGEWCPFTIRLEVWGSIVSSSSGVRGETPAENGFYAYLRSERSHLKHHFQYTIFKRWRTPQTSRGSGKTLPPSRRAWLYDRSDSLTCHGVRRSISQFASQIIEASVESPN